MTFPYEIVPIEGEDGDELLEYFPGEDKGFVQIGPKKWVYPVKYAEHAEEYYNFKFREDDLWLVTYPKSGSTWMQELLWLINNDLDYETASEVKLMDRFPFLEFHMLQSDKYIKEVKELNEDNPEVLEGIEKGLIPGYTMAETMESPRHFKTHITLSLLTPNLIDNCKVIFVIRNPLDVAVSFYHHSKLLRTHDYQGDFNKFWEFFEKDLLLFSPYWEHIKEGWELRDHPNALFLFYEDLVRNLPENIKKISTFLNKNMNDEEIAKLADHVHIDNFRKNVQLFNHREAVGVLNKGGQGFIRRGKVGGNVEMEDEELRKRAQAWFEENLSKTDVKFPDF